MAKLCTNPLWPCAMVGAAAAMAGLEGAGVIIHGASGCYFYADSIIPDPVNCTYLVEDEVIFGTGDRLQEVAEALLPISERIVVINSCVPATIGEDLVPYCAGSDALIIDAPGYCGDMMDGYRLSLAAFPTETDPARDGVNIDGLISTDPFAAGNRMEAERLLAAAGIPVAAKYCDDTLSSALNPAMVTVTALPDVASGIGRSVGSLCGLDAIESAFSALQETFPDADCASVMDICEETEELVIKACDRYLRVNDPPRVALFGIAGYMDMAADLLTTFLEAEICSAGARNRPPEASVCTWAPDLGTVKQMIADGEPDLIIGSRYEKTLAPDVPLVQTTIPIRKHSMLCHRPLIGTEGVLWLIESVINAGKNDC
ncbi:nitrogenase component 1 [Methanogenium organophilum]|uniref:Oxalate:formate antiporter n=1 Tax=Methanogenium organophilum TaxID=2199 RepID=A0A9X9S531_METOG|nr:nitrogenase component 1 [Methanogenium organophilum]WAI02074.1 oxalate:formate antiporter [Methanogenium organophilum]